MDKIIDKLYGLQFNIDNYPLGITNKENIEKEYGIYYILQNNLLGENKDLFLRYVDLNEERRSEELRVAYENGFKTAIKLVLEGISE